MAFYQTSFGPVEEFKSCFSSYFSTRKPSKEIIDEFYNYASQNSKSAKEACSHYERVSYGNDDKQFLDVFYPKEYNENMEVVIFFHGGYWHEGSADLYWFLCRPIINENKVFVIISRQLCPAVRIFEILGQDKEALKLISKKFFQTKQLTIFGHSSGGHEAIMMMSQSWGADHDELNSFLKQKLKRVVSLCGVLDVTSLLRSIVDEDLNMTWEEALSVSPLTHITQFASNVKEYQTKLIFVNVENEAPNILKWMKVFEKEMIRKGINYKSLHLKEKDHFNVVTELDQGSHLMKIILGVGKKVE